MMSPPDAPLQAPTSSTRTMSSACMTRVKRWRRAACRKKRRAWLTRIKRLEKARTGTIAHSWRRRSIMEFVIPRPLKLEHEDLHNQLRAATREGGSLGEAAKTVAKLMHPHFV